MIEVIISTMILQMKQSFARPMFRFCLIANPILNTILLYEMFRESGATNYMAYVTLGAGLMGLWGCICFSSAFIAWSIVFYFLCNIKEEDYDTVIYEFALKI